MHTLRLLGPPLLEGPAGPVSGRVTQERKLALLAVLAMAEGRTLTRDSLAAMFWPESDQSRARHNVTDSVWIIRSALCDEAILGQGNRLTLNREVVASDVDAFEAALGAGDLPRAVGAYTGRFMEGFHISGAPDFERWLGREQARLAAAHAGALEELVRTGLEAGEAAKAADWARRLAAVDPLNTRRALLCMEALAASGDLAGAVRHGEGHGELLREELDFPPPPEVEERIRELRASPPPVAGVRVPVPIREPSPRGEGASAPPTPSGPVPPTEGRRWRGSAPLVALGAVAVLVFLAWMSPGSTDGNVLAPVPHRIVVVAFENRTGDPELDLLGRMTADALVRGLTRAGVGEIVLPPEMLATGVGTDHGPRGPLEARALAAGIRAGIAVSGTIDPHPEGPVLVTTVHTFPESRARTSGTFSRCPGGSPWGTIIPSPPARWN